MKINREKDLSFIQKVLVICIAVIAVFLLLNFDKVWNVIAWIFDVLVPVIIGICLAFVLNPLVESYYKLYNKIFKKQSKIGAKVGKPLSIFLSIISVFLIIALILLVAIPEIGSAIDILSDTVPGMVQSFLDWIYNVCISIGIEIDPIKIDTISWNKIGTYLLEFFTTGSISDIISNIPGAVASVAGVVFNIVIGIVFAISILGNKKRLFDFIEKWMRLYLKPNTASNIKYSSDLIANSFRNFVTGQLTEVSILFLLCMLGMSIFGFPYVVATSAIIAITALIPMFGAWIGGALGALLALTVSPLKMVLFVIFLVILNLIDNYVVYPRVVGNQMKIPSLIVLTSVVVGGNIAGILGMIFAVPIVSVIYVLVNRTVNKREELLLSREGMAQAEIASTDDKEQ